MKAHMSELAKKILNDDKARKQLDEAVFSREKNAARKEVEYNNKKYNVKFVDR